MYISDSEEDDELRLPCKVDWRKSDSKSSRHSCRCEALKEVDYNTRHHPQDKDIPGFRRRRLVQLEEDSAATRALSAKRCKTTR